MLTHNRNVSGNVPRYPEWSLERDDGGKHNQNKHGDGGDTLERGVFTIGVASAICVVSATAIVTAVGVAEISLAFARLGLNTADHGRGTTGLRRDCVQAASSYFRGV